MSSSKELPEPVEFFVDRSLGRHDVPNALRAAGLVVHTMFSVFGTGAEERVNDERWIEEGSRRQWILLTKDERIRYVSAERAAIEHSGGRVFCLANQQLRSATQVAWFLDNIERIQRIVASVPGPYIYKVREASIEFWWKP